MQAVPVGRLPPGKPGTPPCKSGQLEKDLGLEVSSARHAARPIIFEIMRSFFRWFKCSSPAWNQEPSSQGALSSRLASVDSGLQLNLEIAQVRLYLRDHHARFDVRLPFSPRLHC